MSESTKPIEFGVLLPQKFQLLDAVGPIDFINNISYGYLSGFDFVTLPEAILKKAPVINWHWISAAGDLKPVTASIGPPFTPTATFESAPQLDYILCPGPDPTMALSDEAKAWIKGQFPGLKGLLTVCTGSMFFAQTGLFDGVQAATNKSALKAIVDEGKYEPFSKVKWVTDSRFVKDGKIWTAAGITAGIDLGAEFLRVHFDKDLVTMNELGAEYQPLPAKPDAFAHILQGVQL